MALKYFKLFLQVFKNLKQAISCVLTEQDESQCWHLKR